MNPNDVRLPNQLERRLARGNQSLSIATSVKTMTASQKQVLRDASGSWPLFPSLLTTFSAVGTSLELRLGCDQHVSAMKRRGLPNNKDGTMITSVAFV